MGTRRSAIGQFFSVPSNKWRIQLQYIIVACEQAPPGRSSARRENEGELATTSLEFENLHRKRRCEMLIGGDDKSSDAITLGTCFSMIVYVRSRFRFALIGGHF